MRTVTRISQLTVAAALGLSLAACGSSSSSGGSTAAGKKASSAAGQASGASSSPGSASSSSASQPSTSGGSDQAGTPNAKTLVHEARTAYGSAKSANMNADIVGSDGGHQKTGIKGRVDGTNQEVTMDQGKTKGVAVVRTVSGKYYLKGDKTFWTKASGAPKNAATLLTGKWVIMPASGAGSFKELTIRNFLDEVMGPKNLTDAELAKARTARTTYHGQPAYVVTSAKAANKDTITLSADKKQVLEVDGNAASSASGSGKVTITNWDKEPQVGKPAGAINLPSSMK